MSSKKPKKKSKRMGMFKRMFGAPFSGTKRKVEAEKIKNVETEELKSVVNGYMWKKSHGLIRSHAPWKKRWFELFEWPPRRRLRAPPPEPRLRLPDRPLPMRSACAFISVIASRSSAVISGRPSNRPDFPFLDNDDAISRSSPVRSAPHALLQDSQRTLCRSLGHRSNCTNTPHTPQANSTGAFERFPPAESSGSIPNRALDRAQNVAASSPWLY